jgi:Exportin-T
MKGDAICSRLQTAILPALGMSPAATEQYVKALKEMDLKQFKKYFVVQLKSDMI